MSNNLSPPPSKLLITYLFSLIFWPFRLKLFCLYVRIYLFTFCIVRMLLRVIFWLFSKNVLILFPVFKQWSCFNNSLCLWVGTSVGWLPCPFWPLPEKWSFLQENVWYAKCMFTCFTQFWFQIFHFKFSPFFYHITFWHSV